MVQRGGGRKKARTSPPASRAPEIIGQSLVWEAQVGWTTECMPHVDGVLPRYHRAGFDHLSLIVAAEWDAPHPALAYLAKVRRWFLERPEQYVIVEDAEDVVAAAAAGRMAISFCFAGAGPFGSDPNLVEPFYRLGVKQAIVSYNGRNALGDGCQEPGNAGLSMLGQRFVAAMNRAGMLIDLSHVGERTALDAIEASEDPVVFSHSNLNSVYPHVRNISDRMLKACARKQGVLGLNALGFMLNGKARADVKSLLRHADRAAQLVGPAHLGLGLDWNFYDPFMQKMYAENPQLSKLGYPPPPWDSLPPEMLPDLVEGLLRLGWSEVDVKGLLGGNFLRVARRVWR